jgi:hypothetical protein
MNAYEREQIDNWAADFAHSDRVSGLPLVAREHAVVIAAQFLVSACGFRDVPVAEIEQEDVRRALLEDVARLSIPPAAQPSVPALCGEFLTMLEDDGRLSDGRLLGAFVRALRPSFERSAGGKGTTASSDATTRAPAAAA